MTILIVDDSLTVRMDLCDAFAAAGLVARTCASLAEARAALAQGSFALVVLDVLLPDGDGVALLKEIRDSAAATAVILLSSEAQVRDRIRGLSTGADEYVGKPYEPGYVVARARQLLARGKTFEPSAQRTILVIDDSATFREVLRQALEGAGHAVLCAASGEEGLRLAAGAMPTAIIVDGQLPGIDGPAVVRRVRMDVRLRRTPCLLLTASGAEGAELEALDAGADAFVRKDEEIAVMLARLGALLRGLEDPHDGDHGKAGLVGPKKILLVDDSETFLQALAAQLRTEGYDVAAARGGEEGLALLAAQAVDCVLLDLQMPGMDGRETCRRIKDTPALRAIPVIILTAMEDRAALVEGLAVGADDYLTKAGDFEVLRARVLAQIRRKQFEDENRFIREKLARQELEAVATRSARALSEMQAVMAERKRAEEKMNRLQAELTHVSRWNVMGMMAASLAHELNQPLTAVKNYVTAARRLLEAPEGVVRAREMMDKAAGQAMQAGAIIRNLRDFIEKKEVNRSAHEINTVVEEAAALGLVGAASRDINARLELAAGLETVFINKIQVQQVLVNLFRNAVEAMAGEGRRELTVTTGRDEAGFVAVAVSDTGPGIAPEMMARLFQPFSTSKQEGMGIGLKICQSIIEAHDGRIWVTPNDSGGVAFRFRLPVAEAPEEASRAV